MNPLKPQRKSQRQRKVSSVLSKHFLVPVIPGFATPKAPVVTPASDVVEDASEAVNVEVAGTDEPAVDVVLEVVPGSVGDAGDVLAQGGETDTVPTNVSIEVEEVPDPEEVLDPDPSPDDVEPEPGPSKPKPRWRKMSPEEEMRGRLDIAVKDFQDGNFQSIRECARVHRVARTMLAKLIRNPEAEFTGYGRRSQVFSKDEETMISAHIKERMMQGCGLTVLQVQCPEKPWMQHLPTQRFVRTFLKRNHIVWRSSMPLNQGRAILRVEDLRE